jgi:hypothetical protein
VTQLQALLAPVFLHVLLVLYVGFRTVTARVGSVRSGETRIKNIALDTSGWPPGVRKLGNNFDNQFDMPIMWYALVGLIIATAKIDTVFVMLAWLFLVARVLHALIHTGSNNVPYRMYAYLSGFAALILMWAWFAVRIFAAA